MKKLLLTVFAFTMLTANTQNYELVADINQTQNGLYYGSDPAEITEFNNKLYFRAKGPFTGTELYSFDGTNSSLVSDIYSGMQGWGFQSSNPNHLTVSNSNLYFTATDGTYGDSIKLFKTDMNDLTTEVVKLNLQGGHTHYVRMIDYNNKLYYTSYDNLNNEWILWEYDGTNAPTSIFAHSSSISSSFESLIVYNSKLYFYKNTTTTKFWEYDGVNAPIPAPNMIGFNSITEGIVFNSNLYLVMSNPNFVKLWKYDGINAPIEVSMLPSSTQVTYPKNLAIYNSSLYFHAFTAANGAEIWKTDGNTASMVADISIGTASSYPSNLTTYNNKLYFQALDTFSGYELWMIDGTNAPVLVEDLFVGASNHSLPNYLTVFQNKLFFGANDGTVARELYSYDGTNIALASDILYGSAGSGIRPMIEFKNKLYFAANGEDGRELWTTDGINTEQVIDIDTANIGWLGSPSSSSPQSFVVFNDKLYFKANDGSGISVWVYDGVNQPIKDLTIPSIAFGFKVLQDKLYFSQTIASETKIWVYDGINPISKLSDLFPSLTHTFQQNSFIFQDKLYFRATDIGTGTETWEYDGTNIPTIFADLNTGNGYSSVGNFIEFDSKIIFTAYTDTIIGGEMWVKDGNNAPTLLYDLYPGFTNNYGNSSYPSYFNIIDNKLYFVATSAEGKNIWMYDGTNTPSVIVDIYPGAGAPSQNLISFTAIDEKMYYWADNGTGIGHELYIYDGTNSPALVPELNSGLGSSKPSNASVFIPYEGHIYFAASDGIIGGPTDSELFRISGCALDNSITLNNNTLTASLTGATYQWVDCNNNNSPISGATNAVFVPTQSGNYACNIDNGNCSRKSDCIDVTIIGISDFELNSSIILYPNPVFNQLSIINDELSILKIDIIDVMGKTIKTVTENTNTIDVSELNKGTYFIKIQTTKGQINKRFVKM